MSGVRGVWVGSPDARTDRSDRCEGESEYIAMLSPESRESYREFMARRHDPQDELEDRT